MTIPGVGPLIATALVALAPPPQTFRRARDFAAWLGLTPRQHSTGGKQRLGATTKMAERSLKAAPDHRGQQRRHQAAHEPDGAAGHLAGRDAETQATDAGAGGAREQDGADRLGLDEDERSLPSSGRGVVKGHGREVV